jgi:TPR repeat protein
MCRGRHDVVGANLRAAGHTGVIRHFKTLPRRLLASATVALVLMLGGGAVAADFQAGVDALKHGDYAKAVTEFRPLANQGMASAQTNLGLMYSRGWGVAADDAQAFRWYRLAAEQGYPVAENNIGVMYLSGMGGAKDPVLGLMWLMLAADDGYAPAKDAVRNQQLAMSSTEVLIAKQMAMLWKEKETLRRANPEAAALPPSSTAR